MADPTLKHTTTVSLFWSFLDKFGQQIVNLATGIILMRILDPSEYGLVGALTIFIAFSGILIDSGFTRALLNRKVISSEEYSTVFFFNVGLALFLYLIFYTAAPLLAVMFHEPMITSISPTFSSLIFNSVGIIQQTLLIRKADFRGMTKINISALFIAGIVAIVMAVTGYGVWALVMQTLVYSFFRSLFLWIYSKWTPVSIFSFKLLRSFSGLSNKLLLTSLINAFFNNIYPPSLHFFI